MTTGKLILKNKKLLTALLFVCLGLNSQVITTLSNNSDLGTTSLASSEKTPEGCEYGELIIDKSKERQEKIFASKYHPEVYDDDESEEVNFDDEMSDSITTRSEKRGNSRHKTKKIKFAVTYSQLYCIDEKTGESKATDQYKVKKVKVEADTNLGCESNKCIGLEDTVIVKDVKNLEDILEHLIEGDFGDQIRDKFKLKEFLAMQKARVKDCEGRLMRSSNSNGDTKYDFVTFTESLEDQNREMKCLVKKLKKIKDSKQAIHLFETRLKDDLHSLSMGEKTDRKTALKIIKSLSHSTSNYRSYSRSSYSLPTEINSSLKSMQLYITSMNNTKEAYEPFRKEKNRLDLLACQGEHIVRPDNPCNAKISDNDYQLAVSRLNAHYHKQMNQVQQITQFDQLNYNREFQESEYAQNSITPYLNQLKLDFESHMNQIYSVYGGQQKVDTNSTVTAGDGTNSVLTRFDGPVSALSTTPDFAHVTAPDSTKNSNLTNQGFRRK